MSLRRFFAYSFLFHSFILIVAILMVPNIKIKKTGSEFITRLVSPEEVMRYKPVVPSLPDRKIIQEGKRVPSAKIKGYEGRITEQKKETFKEGNKAGSSKETTTDDKITGLSKAPQPLVRGQIKEPSLREKLFDKNVIGDIAKKESRREEFEKGRTFTFDVSEYKFLVYNRRLKERIESIWIYPPTAASRGIYGDLLIKFTIKKNGNLGEVELVRTSGHKELDDAAIKALKDGAPYWPLPEEWGMDNYTILGHFVYTIYGYYIR